MLPVRGDWLAYEYVFCAQVYCLSVSRLLADGMAGTEKDFKTGSLCTNPPRRSSEEALNLSGLFPLALRCHCSHLPQRHNDADCPASVERVRRKPTMAFLSGLGNGQFCFAAAVEKAANCCKETNWPDRPGRRTDSKNKNQELLSLQILKRCLHLGFLKLM